MLFSTISVVAALLVAETSDTLQAVTVVADRGVVVSRTDTVQITSSISISDAFASIPGLYVADYGGLAGLKSVSLRGFSSFFQVYLLRRHICGRKFFEQEWFEELAKENILSYVFTQCFSLGRNGAGMPPWSLRESLRA